MRRMIACILQSRMHNMQQSWIQESVVLCCTSMFDRLRTVVVGFKCPCAPSHGYARISKLSPRLTHSRFPSSLIQDIEPDRFFTEPSPFVLEIINLLKLCDLRCKVFALSFSVIQSFTTVHADPNAH